MIHNEYVQENPRINRQDWEKITFPGSAYPKISQQCTPAIHTEAVHCQGVLLGVFHPCPWPLKAPGSTLGRVAKPLVSLLTPVPPIGQMHSLSKTTSDKALKVHIINRLQKYWCMTTTLEQWSFGRDDASWWVNWEIFSSTSVLTAVRDDRVLHISRSTVIKLWSCHLSRSQYTTI